MKIAIFVELSNKGLYMPFRGYGLFAMEVERKSKKIKVDGCGILSVIV